MNVRVLTMAAAAAVLAAGTAQAQKVLRVSSWAPPTHHINSEILPTWGKWIEEASNGRLSIKIEYGLAPPPGQFDVARDGIADIAWGSHGYTPGRYVLTKGIEVPGLSTSAEALSVAYWRVHEKYFAKVNEHRGVKLLGLMVHGPGMIHTKEPLNSLADLKGMKIRVGGGTAGRVGELLGVVGVQVPAPKVYETLAQGVADGVFFPIESKKAFRIYEIAPYTTVMPGGLYTNSFGFVMNPDSFDGLSKADQDALVSVSGEKLSQMAGAAWDAADVAGMKVSKEAGNTIGDVPAADAKTFQEIASTLETEWVAAAKAKDVDGTAVMAEIRQILAGYGK
ncbi:MAG: TRAP transporter substrate-binding protein [Alphaproteobacteria bacterium]